jgi:hypothetical protein
VRVSHRREASYLQSRCDSFELSGKSYSLICVYPVDLCPKTFFPLAIILPLTLKLHYLMLQSLALNLPSITRKF